MKYEDILPILVLLIYVALVFAKHRKTKSDLRKKPVPKGAPKVESREVRPQKTAARPESTAPKPAPAIERAEPMPAVKPVPPIERVEPKQAAKFDRPGPKLLSVIGKRVRQFFAEMEQQFREELERARTQGMEPPMDGEPFFEYHEEPMAPEPGEPVPGPVPEAHPVVHVLPDKPTGPRHRCRSFRGRSRCRHQIRNAVVWSEILEPPLALRQGKRPWEI